MPKPDEVTLFGPDDQEKNQGRENLPDLNEHQNRIVRYMLQDEEQRYLKRAGKEPLKEDEFETFLTLMSNNKFTDADVEGLLNPIFTRGDMPFAIKYRMEILPYEISVDKHFAGWLAFLTSPKADSDFTERRILLLREPKELAKAMDDFYDKYPNPLALDRDGNPMGLIRRVTTADPNLRETKKAEYGLAYESFKALMYGKRNEYYNDWLNLKELVEDQISQRQSEAVTSISP